jgi:L-alanine-DL-glutamate epimerase-like enolase superfamily enzyme
LETEGGPALAECRRQIAIPIVTGEELYTRAEFRRAFELRAADIVIPMSAIAAGPWSYAPSPRWPSRRS